MSDSKHRLAPVLVYQLKGTGWAFFSPIFLAPLYGATFSMPGTTWRLQVGFPSCPFFAKFQSFKRFSPKRFLVSPTRIRFFPSVSLSFATA